MADGIQIRDAAVEISPAGLEAILRKEGAALTVTKLDLSVSPDALSALLRGLGAGSAVSDTAAPAAAGSAQLSGAVEEGRLQLSAARDGRSVDLDLRMAGLRLEFTAEGLRLVGE